MTDALPLLRAFALNNAWANERLLGACGALTDAEFAATRTGFFPSLRKTLNHILLVDIYYLDAMERGATRYGLFDDEEPYADLASLAEMQRASDRRLIAFCAGLHEADLARIVPLDRGPAGIDHERIGDILPHLFQHQIHHRGQAHAMLSSTAVAPPQLDEFFLMVDRPVRDAELERAGLGRALS